MWIFRRKWIERNSKFTPNWKALVNVFSNFHKKIKKMHWQSSSLSTSLKLFLELLLWFMILYTWFAHPFSSTWMHRRHFLQSILGQSRKYVLYKTQTALQSTNSSNFFKIWRKLVNLYWFALFVELVLCVWVAIGDFPIFHFQCSTWKYLNFIPSTSIKSRDCTLV